MQKVTNHASFAQLSTKENKMIRRILILRRYITEIDSIILYLVLNAKSTRFYENNCRFQRQIVIITN